VNNLVLIEPLADGVARLVLNRPAAAGIAAGVGALGLAIGGWMAARSRRPS